MHKEDDPKLPFSQSAIPESVFHIMAKVGWRQPVARSCHPPRQHGSPLWQCSDQTNECRWILLLMLSSCAPTLRLLVELTRLNERQADARRGGASCGAVVK